MWVSREIVLGYKGVGGSEREGRNVDMSGISGYGVMEYLDKLDGIVDEEIEFAILVLAILVAIFRKKMYTHFDLLLKNLHRRNGDRIHQLLQTQDLQPLKKVILHKIFNV